MSCNHLRRRATVLVKDEPHQIPFNPKRENEVAYLKFDQGQFSMSQTIFQNSGEPSQAWYLVIAHCPVPQGPLPWNPFGQVRRKENQLKPIQYRFGYSNYGSACGPLPTPLLGEYDLSCRHRLMKPGDRCKLWCPALHGLGLVKRGHSGWLFGTQQWTECVAGPRKSVFRETMCRPASRILTLTRYQDKECKIRHPGKSEENLPLDEWLQSPLAPMRFFCDDSNLVLCTTRSPCLFPIASRVEI